MGISKKKSLMACPANTVFWGDFMKKQREGNFGENFEQNRSSERG